MAYSYQAADSTLSPEEKSRKDEIHRKIGRNLVLLQKIEVLLKELVFRGNLSISFNLSDRSDTAPKIQILKQRAAVSRKTMGPISQLFCDNCLTEPKQFPDDLGATDGEAKFQFRMHYGTDAQQKEWQSKLKEIVDERNRLVHHLFDFRSTEEMEAFLAQQHDKTIPVFNVLMSLAECIDKQAAERSALIQTMIKEDTFSNSPDVKELIVALWFYSRVLKKEDSLGWTCLAAAGAYLSRNHPEARTKCMKFYKKNSLEKVLLETGCFDIIKLPTENGGRRPFFRMKPECWIKCDDEGRAYLCKRLPAEEGELSIQPTST